MKPYAKILSLAFLLGAITSSDAMTQPYRHMRGRIDTTVYRYIDVTGDTIPEIVSLHLKALNFKAPFDWTLQIWSRDKDLLYSFSEHDSATDYLLQLESGLDSDSTFNANDWNKYQQTKYDFFFKKFAGLSVSYNLRYGVPEYRYKRSYDGSIYTVAQKYLIGSCHMSAKDARLAIDNAVKRLKRKEIPVVIHDVGVDTVLPMAYFPECKKLVPIYSD